MARVDPYVVKLPTQLVDLKTGEATKEFAEWLTYDNRWKQQVWIKVGGGDDFITDTEEGLTSASSKIARNNAKIDSLEDISFKVEFTTVSTTVNAFETLICNNSSAINVTLDTDAIENDVVNIKRNNAQVTVIGTIDGQVDMVLNVPKYSTKLVFNGTDWSRI